jgi:hypothetical protein
MLKVTDLDRQLTGLPAINVGRLFLARILCGYGCLDEREEHDWNAKNARANEARIGG